MLAEDIKDLNLKELGLRVRTRRLYMGMSQAELARRAQLERTSIWAIERGKSGIGLSAAWRIVQALDFSSMEEMMGVKGEMK